MSPKRQQHDKSFLGVEVVIYIDVDETICTTIGDKTCARDYSQARPIKKNIIKANKLYDSGHTIVYWTARGTMTGIDWTDVTIQQLSDWGAKYHSIKLGKPNFDLYICDKVLNVKDWSENVL